MVILILLILIILIKSCYFIINRDNRYIYILVIIITIMKTTQDKIDEAEKKLTQLKKQLKKEQDKSDWIKIPELKIEIQTKIHHKNKTYTECENDLSKGESIPTYEQIQWLRNSKYKDQLNLDDSYEFVQNPDNISRKNGYVAGFYAGSVFAYLDCYRDSSGSGSDLGVRFVRRTKGGKKSTKTSK